MVDTKGEVSPGFPGDCPTNAYLLEGFAHVVYMVSTVAGGSAGNEAATVSRLKNAEKELRSQSLLVSLDLESNELFTFHRLIDFQKDGKNIYGRLATVLRHNQCIISFKSALRATDLLKDEHSRLRAFLLSAVLSALKPGLVDETNFVPLGTRTFLRVQTSKGAQTWDTPEIEERTIYHIDMINLQLLSNGQLLVTNVTRKPEHFQAVSEILKQTVNDENISSLEPGILCLAPTGQMARYTNGQVISGSLEIPKISHPVTAQSDIKDSHMHDARLRVWKEELSIWLANQGLPQSGWIDDYWVEVEILLSEKLEKEDADAHSTGSDQLIWKRLLWPAQFCFYAQKHVGDVLAEASLPEDDPFEFVRDWMLRSEERARAIAGNPVSRPIDYENEPQHGMADSMEEDIGFDSTPQMHNAFSTALPPSQMMYPTPPDVPFMQATPGMSSVDGIGMTPAETTRLGPVGAEQLQDIDMLDHIDTSGVGTGTYDEDLFEDLPTDRFGVVGTADEPDWDFFEQHNASFDDQPGRGEVLTQDSALEGDAIPEDTCTPKHDQEDNEDSMLPPQIPESTSGRPAASALEQAQLEMITADSTSAMITKPATIEVQEAIATDVPANHPVSPQAESRSIIQQDPAAEIWKKPPIPPSRGRRRSLYDSSEDLTATSNNDERYSANGAFWFDAGPSARPSTEEEIGGGHMNTSSSLHGVPSPHRSSEGSSESETSSFYELSEMDLDEDGPPAKRKWTEYERTSTSVDLDPTAEELGTIEADTQHLLRLLRPLNLDHTWMFDSPCGSIVPTPTPSIKPEHASMVAQILVDQCSQTSVIRDAELRLQTSPADSSRPNISGPLEGPYGRLEPATMSALAKINDGAAQNDAANRLSMLERHQLSVLRGEKALLLSSPALSLWETLNLQPKGGKKNVQAFCMHPASACLETGCYLFLERIREVYVSCNLGDHDFGQLGGTSNNGLVSWSDHDEVALTLQQSCERLGTALARLPPASNNIVIYMIHVPGSAVSPVTLVEGFCVLFEAYVKACNKQNPIELALQIVPIDFVASPDTLVVRSPQEYISLAIEVYNRFPPSQLGDKPATCGSAVVLHDSPRRRIRFDMAGQSGSGSGTGGQCLHLSYSYSENKRWIVAAWTDERGFRALTMCYGLQEGGKISRPHSAILQDMWEVSQELMGKEQRRWRLIVAMDGHYDPSEVNEWATQYNNNTGPTKCALALVSVDLAPMLTPQISAVQPKTTQGTTPQQPLHSYGTPGSTPQGSTTSPDQYLTATPTPSGSVPVNAPTPPEVVFDPNNEADLTVQDATEESWSVVLPFGLNQSQAVLESRPAMLSGYLLKRRGIRDEDGLSQLGVNLIHTSTAQSPAAREELLKDVLGQYRGLVTLAHTRGCIDSVQDVVPWHVAASIKGARVLNKWM
jgi:mediator of RNA polymerase II transcription subunit 13, fungi type